MSIARTSPYPRQKTQILFDARVSRKVDGREKTKLEVKNSAERLKSPAYIKIGIVRIQYLSNVYHSVSIGSVLPKYAKNPNAFCLVIVRKT